MPNWRPIRDPSRPIEDWHAGSSMSNSSPMRQIGLRWGMLFSDGSPISHVGLRLGMSVFDQEYQPLIRHVGPWSGMLVTHGSLIRYVGLRWVLDQICRSPMGPWSDMLVSNGSLIRHVGLRWVSDQICRSPIGLDGSTMIIIFSWTPPTGIVVTIAHYTINRSKYNW